MELIDILIEIERYISIKGLTHDDPISTLIEALDEDTKDEL